MTNSLLFLNLKNAQLSNKSFTFQKNSHKNRVCLQFLWNKGFIFSFSIVKKKIKINFKYFKSAPVLKYLKTISKPSRKIYFSFKQICKLNSNKDFLFSTNQGLKSIIECKNIKLGGELILLIR